MLTWSKPFETGIELVDSQHKRLFVLLNTLADSFSAGTPNEAVVAQTLQELLDYAHQHFTEEEALMKTHHVDPQHLSIHHMEHNSFSYHLGRLQLHTNADEDVVRTAEKLVRFITSWLVYHVLGIDKVMAAQIYAIEQGMTPQQAYSAHKTIGRDTVTTQLILDAVLELWRSTTEHCRALEEELASYRKAP
jgi:hemerythrin